MKKHLYIVFVYVALLACFLCGCGGGPSDEPTPVGPEQPVWPPTPPSTEQPLGFVPSESVQSRAGSRLEDTHKLFKVWAYKNTSSSSGTSAFQTVMPGYQVKFLEGASGWQYDGCAYSSHTELSGQLLKYWDASALRYDFYAFAPAQVPEGVEMSFDPSVGFTISGLPTHTETPFDCVVAKQTRHLNDSEGLRDIDALVNIPNEHQPSLFYDPVPLVFHHILSKVEYRIYNTGSKTAVINEVIVNYDNGETLNTAGDFTNGGWTNFSKTSNTLMSMIYIEPNQLKLEPITKDNYKTHSHSLITYYEIPQSLNRHIVVSVNVNGEIVSETFDMGQSSWDYDTFYVYYIHLEVGDSSSSPILIDLTLNDFEEGDPVEETQTNW